MKEELLLRLSCIMTETTPIKFRVNEIHEIRQQLDKLIDDNERLFISNKIKSLIQNEATSHWIDAGSRGAVLGATGVGKSKIGIMAAEAEINDPSYLPKILIVVPTEKLRDEGWKNEFYKWQRSSLWENVIEMTCYASLSKYIGQKFDLVILDEGHNITDNNGVFFNNNEVAKILWLSATKPKDPFKIQLLKKIGVNPVYEITLDEAVKLGIVSSFEITVITVPLDNKNANIPAGSKTNSFMATEASNYKYLTKKCIAFPSKNQFLERMRFIYNLRSKAEASKWILENIVPKDKRTIIFTGSKQKAMELCDEYYFSKPSKPKKLEEGAKPYKIANHAKKVSEYESMIAKWKGDKSFSDFVNKLINRISCCEALNEGHNIPDVDVGFIEQLNSAELDLWQRIGRTIRFRPGHTSQIIIMCAKGTEDFKWVNKATANLDENNIRWIKFEDLKSGKETIKF